MNIVCSPVIITPDFGLHLSPLIPSCFPSGKWFSCKSYTSLAQLEENSFLLEQPTGLFLLRPYKNYGHDFKSVKGRALLEKTLLWLTGELTLYFLSFWSSCLPLSDLLPCKHKEGKIPQGRAEPRTAPGRASRQRWGPRAGRNETSQRGKSSSCSVLDFFRPSLKKWELNPLLVTCSVVLIAGHIPPCAPKDRAQVSVMKSHLCFPQLPCCESWSPGGDRTRRAALRAPLGGFVII